MIKKEDRPLFAALLAVAAAIFFIWAVPSPNRIQENGDGKCTTHECREDAATEAVAKYTKWLAWFTAALAIASIGQGIFLIRADRATRKSIDLARAEFLATHRPRIRIRWVSGPDSPEGGGEETAFSVAIVNIGESRAMITEYYIDVSVFDDIGCFCNGVRLKDEATRDILLQPGENYKFEVVSEKPISDKLWERLQATMSQEHLVLSGEITYRDEAKLERHTGFARQLAFEGSEHSIFKPHATREYED